jgi:hypothetical protein
MVAKGLIVRLEAKAGNEAELAAFLQRGLRRRELAHRASSGIEVTLYWSPDDGTSIEVRHAATEELIAFPIAPERALDAYYHPFASLAIPLTDPIPAGGL